MRSFLSLVFAGILGSLLTLGGLYLIQGGPELLGASAASTPTQLVRYPGPADGRAVPGTSYPVPAYAPERPAAAPPAAPAPLPNFREAAAAAMPAVVHIAAVAGGNGRDEAEENYNPFRFFFEDEPGQNPFGGNMPRQGSGSGVIYSSNGYIVTNFHVVDGADELEVTLYDNRSFPAEVVGTYEKSDLAVVRIDATGLPTLDFADSDAAAVGEWALAVGNPFDLTSTVTAGIISAKGRSLQLLDGRDAIEAFLQTDAAVNPGNSGGALVDAQGRLLGINTAIATRSGVFQGYSFAIPVNLVRRIADDIIAYGDYQRAYLGVTITQLDADYARQLGVGITQGVVIEELVDGGSAQYAGLQPKDIIIEVDGRSIRGVPELQEVIGRSKVGDVVRITVERRGERREFPVRLKAG